MRDPLEGSKVQTKFKFAQGKADAFLEKFVLQRFVKCKTFKLVQWCKRTYIQIVSLSWK